MTETLPANPSPDVGVKRSHKPNLQVAQFGDGYSQRASFGLNQVALEVTLTYTNIITSEKAILEEFVNDHSRGEPFFYTMPDETDERTFYFSGWDFVYVKHGVFQVTLNMKECFDIL